MSDWLRCELETETGPVYCRVKLTNDEEGNVTGFVWTRETSVTKKDFKKLPDWAQNCLAANYPGLFPGEQEDLTQG